MNYREIYDAILALQRDLQADLLQGAGEELAVKPSLRREPDYKKVKALAAAFELQEYLAGKIAAAVAAGELDPDPEY